MTNDYIASKTSIASTLADTFQEEFSSLPVEHKWCSTVLVAVIEFSTIKPKRPVQVSLSLVKYALWSAPLYYSVYSWLTIALYICTHMQLRHRPVDNRLRSPGQQQLQACADLLS